MNRAFNKKLFKDKIAENHFTLKTTAGILGCNEVTLYRKINGESDFTRNEIQLFRQAFNLTAEDVDAIFFAQQLA